MAGCAELSDKPQADPLLILRGDPSCFPYIHWHLAHIPFLESPISWVSSADMGKGLRNLQLTLQGFCMLDFNVQPCVVFFDTQFRFLFILRPYYISEELWLSGYFSKCTETDGI